MTVRVAPSCRAVLDQANQLWPTRSRASDGTVGDARHSTRASDHNPDAQGWVHAVDLTHDPASGCDAHAWARRIVARRDPRVAYVISNGMIANSRPIGGRPAWAWRAYRGVNPHTKHVHVSIHHTTTARSDVSPWFDTAPVTAPVVSPVQEDHVHKIDLVCHLDGGKGYQDVRDADGGARNRDQVLAVVCLGPDPQIAGWDDGWLHEPELTEHDGVARIVCGATVPVTGDLRFRVLVED